MSARRVPTTEFHVADMGAYNKVLIGEEDIHFHDRWKNMLNRRQSMPDRDKDVFWNLINGGIVRLKADIPGQIGDRKPIRFYSDNRDMLEAQQQRIKNGRDRQFDRNDIGLSFDKRGQEYHEFRQQQQQQPQLLQQRPSRQGHSNGSSQYQQKQQDVRILSIDPTQLLTKDGKLYDLEKVQKYYMALHLQQARDLEKEYIRRNQAQPSEWHANNQNQPTHVYQLVPRAYINGQREGVHFL